MKGKSILRAMSGFVLCLVWFSGSSSVQAAGNIYLENFRAIASVIDMNYYKPIHFQECAGGKTIHAIALCNDEACFAEQITEAFSRCLDKNSRYIPSQKVERERQDIQGAFGGVGLELFQDQKTGEVMIIGIIPGSPADGSGIEEGDVIVQVGEKKIKQDTKVDEVVNWIRGPIGREVALHIRRSGVEGELTFLFERKEVVVQTVLEYETPDSAIGYILLSHFTPGTSAALLEKMESENMQGKKVLVLDLRNDPGGLLQEAVCTVALFAPDKKYTVVTTHYRNVNIPETAGECAWLPRGFFEAPHRVPPMVILVNGHSASASEIVAANLQELGFPVVGDRTYKKGTVQTNFGLWSGVPLGELHLTIAEYRTGKHDRVVDGVGVRPNVVVENPKKNSEKEDTEEVRPVFRSKRKLDLEHDLQLKKALEILKTKIAQ